MAELDKHRRVLSREVGAVWPKLAAAVEGIDGYLAGGTALATRLQHRSPLDLDYMAHQEFSGADTGIGPRPPPGFSRVACRAFLLETGRGGPVCSLATAATGPAVFAKWAVASRV